MFRFFLLENWHLFDGLISWTPFYNPAKEWGLDLNDALSVRDFQESMLYSTELWSNWSLMNMGIQGDVMNAGA